MAFMIPYYSNEPFSAIENSRGETTLVQQGYETLEDDEEITATYIGKWFCHLSAPGYMDQTEWSGPFDTEQEAADYIRDTYDVDPDTGEELDDETE